MPQANATGEWNVSDFGSTPLYTAGVPEVDPRVSERDRTILRALADKVAGLAERPREKEMRELWLRHNALERTRPLIVCDPENGWNEIITPDRLECGTSLARRWEMVLRKQVFWGQRMGDDRPIEPVFDVGYTCTDTGWGVEERFRGGVDGGSYTWEPAIRDRGELGKLRFLEIRVDRETTGRTVDLAREVFDGLLTVRLRGVWWWSFGLTYDLVVLRGMERVMIDMIEDPALVHELMRFLMEGTLKKLEYLEAGGLLTLNNDGYLQPGGFGHTRELPGVEFEGRVRTRDLWGYAESQETVGISPAMFEEFIFPYQAAILERFGLNSYGCCEPLERRWEIIRKLPRLRKVSVSAFADWRRMAEQLGDRYCCCLKPHPLDLAVPHLDARAVRKKLRRAFEITRDCRVEVLMQDNHTIGGNPQNVVDWVRIAREEAERV